MSNYTSDQFYQDLDPERKEIRVLDVQPSTGNGRQFHQHSLSVRAHCILTLDSYLLLSPSCLLVGRPRAFL